MNDESDKKKKKNIPEEKNIERLPNPLDSYKSDWIQKGESNERKKEERKKNE